MSQEESEENTPKTEECLSDIARSTVVARAAPGGGFLSRIVDSVGNWNPRLQTGIFYAAVIATGILSVTSFLLNAYSEALGPNPHGVGLNPNAIPWLLTWGCLPYLLEQYSLAMKQKNPKMQ